MRTLTGGNVPRARARQTDGGDNYDRSLCIYILYMILCIYNEILMLMVDRLQYIGIYIHTYARDVKGELKVTVIAAITVAVDRSIIFIYSLPRSVFYTRRQSSHTHTCYILLQ